METLLINCVFCGSNTYEPIWTKDGFNYVKCDICNLIFVNPQLTPETISNVYQVGFKSKCEKISRPPERTLYISELKWAEKYRKFGRLLDIGCFTGKFLQVAKQEGWNVTGTEISIDAAEHAHTQNDLDIRVGDLLDIAFSDGEFDVITMFDVIEHVSDPFIYLKEIKRILRPGGALYLNTPNINSITAKILKRNWSVVFPWHQFYFSPSTLEKLVLGAKFEKISLRTYGIGPISRFNPYHSLKSSGAIVKEKGSIRRIISKFRIVRITVLKINILFKVLFLIVSKGGINLGTTIVLTAEKICDCNP